MSRAMERAGADPADILASVADPVGFSPRQLTVMLCRAAAIPFPTLPHVRGTSGTRILDWKGSPIS